MTLTQFINKVQDKKEELIQTVTSMQKFTQLTQEYNIDLSLFRGDSALGEVARLMVIKESK